MTRRASKESDRKSALGHRQAWKHYRFAPLLFTLVAATIPWHRAMAQQTTTPPQPAPGSTAAPAPVPTAAEAPTPAAEASQGTESQATDTGSDTAAAADTAPLTDSETGSEPAATAAEAPADTAAPSESTAPNEVPADTGGGAAQGGPNDGAVDLLSLSLDELLSIELPETSIATKTAESFVETSGTVYVVTAEDISRYGCRTLKDALELIPNLDLYWNWTRLEGGQRGIVGAFSGTLLLLDGREIQNLESNSTDISNNFPLHRVKRIEVLQGPNSTLYGANSKEGVINIVTFVGDEETQDEGTASLLYGLPSTMEASGLFRRTVRDFTFGHQHVVLQQPPGLG